MAEKPKYLLHADCHLSLSTDVTERVGPTQTPHNNVRVYHAGEVIEYEGLPNAQMEPRNPAAWERFFDYLEYREKRGMAPLTRFPFQVIERRLLGKLAHIPENWADLNGFEIVALARALGLSGRPSKEAAKKFVADEVARRAAADLG